MSVNTNNTTVAIYKTHQEAEHAIHELQKTGFDMRHLSIVGRDFHMDENVIGYYNTGDRMKYWGATGAFWGGLWGMLFGSAFFMIPGIGPLVVAGPLVASFVSTLEGALVGGSVGVLGAALYSLGIPQNSLLRYETAIRTDKFLLIAHGTVKQVALARDIVSRTTAEAYEQHHPGISTFPAIHAAA